MGKRRTNRPEFKTKVPMEAISDCKTFQMIAADHAIDQFTFPGVPWLTNCCVHGPRAGEQAREVRLPSENVGSGQCP